MNHVDLFSGIGGFILAAHFVWLRHNLLLMTEYNREQIKVLRKHWPTVPLLTDTDPQLIKETIGEETTVDLLTAGFRAAPFAKETRKPDSSLGKLWPEMFDVIKAIQPKWIVCQLAHKAYAMGIDTVLSDLEHSGYTQETFIIPSCAVGTPHGLERIWVIAYQEELGRRLVRLVDVSGESLFHEKQKDVWEEGWEFKHKMASLINGIPSELDRYWEVDWDKDIPKVSPKYDNRSQMVRRAVMPQMAYEFLYLVKVLDDLSREQNKGKPKKKLRLP